MAGNLQEGTNVSGTWCGSKRPIALIGLWYVTSFAVSPAAWGSGSPGFEAIPVDASEAPLVVHVDDWEPPVATTDAVVLALRILQGREKVSCLCELIDRMMFTRVRPRSTRQRVVRPRRT